MISKKDFLAGKPFLGNNYQPRPPPPSEPLPRVSAKSQEKQEKIEAKQIQNVNVTALKSVATKAKFKNPLVGGNVLKRPSTPGQAPQPRHDPDEPKALVMKRPANVPKGRQTVDVVVDPMLCKHLREHQRAGVQFMYECVMGMRPFEGEGAILADEMGLGKTLQTIALLWTLLKQNPVYEDQPVVKKALIVCPVTLINNWRQEFRKWLGNERIGVFVVEDRKTRITDFTMGRSYSVMIVGYEKLRLIQDDLKKGPGIDIVIADEGHRLKTAQNKSAQAIKSLNTERRIILSGTPIQNDLSEFFTMVDFVNPGLLGKWSTFKREFEGPILKARQPGASAKDVEKGEARSHELADLTGQFILRRTAEILSKYLPSKTEYVLFCRPTSAQASVYRSVLTSPAFAAVLGSPDASLQLIMVLKKVCNSPSLLHNTGADKAGSEETTNTTITSLLADIPPALLRSPGASGKLQVLDSLLHRIHTTTDEKVVLVSNYTSTLDILSNLLSSLSYTFLRLDGKTPASQRQPLVNKFNRTAALGPNGVFIFLLSAKAGGVGLNLTGASRLILFDVDWNPSTDLQAMARIHRDGQKRRCRIYRLLTQGALDEKIYQRQLMKRGLADSVIDKRESKEGFTQEELRDLFSLDERGVCCTHELLSCTCEGKGNLQALGAAQVTTPEDSMLEEASTPVDESATKPYRPRKRIVDSDDDDDIEDAVILPAAPKLISANEVNMAEQEARLKEEANAPLKMKMVSLMQWAHIDTYLLNNAPAEGKVESKKQVFNMSSGEMDPGDDEQDFELSGDENGSEQKQDVATELEGILDDEVLLQTIREDGNRVGFVFCKTTS